MDIAQLGEIFDWLAPTSICELEFNTPRARLRLRRSVQEERSPASSAASLSEPEILLAGQTPASDAHTHKTLMAKAPCVGVFLHRHPLRLEDLAPVGCTARAGDVIGLMQIGTLLMPLVAPADGVVTEHLVRHGGIVGYAHELMTLQAF